MLGRYAFSIVVGMAVTLSLLFIMQLLIEHAEDAINKERTRYQLDFVRVKRNETLNVDDYTPGKTTTTTRAAARDTASGYGQHRSECADHQYCAATGGSGCERRWTRWYEYRRG